MHVELCLEDIACIESILMMLCMCAKCIYVKRVYDLMLLFMTWWCVHDLILLFIHDFFDDDYVRDMFVGSEALHVVVEYMQIGVVHHLKIWINDMLLNCLSVSDM